MQDHNKDDRPLKLDTVRSILTPALTLVTKPVSDTFYGELDQDFNGFAGHTLLSQFGWDEPWGVWEMHPAGDEFVYLLSGETDFILRINGEDQRHRLSEPGHYVIVPRGVWHTAEPIRATQALFVTPGEGTRNEAEPQS